MHMPKSNTFAYICCMLLGGCGAADNSTDEFVQMVNPLVTVSSVQEMEAMVEILLNLVKEAVNL